jgi:SAM-dependent methyltransferase
MISEQEVWAKCNFIPHLGDKMSNNDINQKFDRKSFDPLSNSIHDSILGHLRKCGYNRHRWYNNRHSPHAQHGPRHYNCCCSPSLRALDLPEKPYLSDVYLDIGCGDSADFSIVAGWGWESYGLDLIPPRIKAERGDFIQSDACDGLPFPDYSISYVTCHAMIALVKPEERLSLYEDVYRVMKYGGVFVLSGIELRNGYGFDVRTERERVLSAGFEHIRSTGTGFVMDKQ